MERRAFVAAVAAGVARWDPGASPRGQPRRRQTADRPMVGIQVGAVSFVDEGTEKVIDLLAESAGVNTLFVASFTYGRGIAGRHYETAKAAVCGFTRAVAVDWAPYNVTVNAIAAGGFMTEPNRRWYEQMPELKKVFESQVPMARLGEPWEIGPLALYLASDASSYMTGSVVVIDGGYTAW